MSEGVINLKISSAVLTIVLALIALISCGRTSLAIEKIAPDQRAVRLIDQFLQALSKEDGESRLNAVIPLVHKSLLTRDGKDLDRSIKDFSYKKAVQGVKFYAIPAEIGEVHKGNTMTIGFEETAERGRIDKYFVKKRKGINGMPAPIHIFWPENGGDPRIVNFGSL